MSIIRKINYENEDREEFTDYYYSMKSNFDTKNDFIEAINEIYDLSLKLSSFSQDNLNNISSKQLELFFHDSGINQEILDLESTKIDWNENLYLLETQDYFILRIWETTA